MREKEGKVVRRRVQERVSEGDSVRKRGKVREMEEEKERG